MKIIKRAPAGLIGMLALIVLVEGAVARHEADFKIGWHWGWKVNGGAARRKADRFSVLCFGDSQVNLGIIPNVLDLVTGERSLNLALSGGQATTTFFQLRRALEAGARPKAILVDFFPLLLNHGHEENTPRWPDYLTTREALEMSRAVGDPGFFARVTLSRLLVTARERDGIRKAIVDSFAGQFVTQRGESVALRRNLQLNQGGVVFDRHPEWDAGDLNAWYKLAFANPEWCTPYHRAYLEKFFELTRKAGTQVFWVVPPLPPEVEEKLAAEGEDDRLDALITSIQDQFPEVTVIDARGTEYPHEVFIDHGHLDRIGARCFTAGVGESIRRKLDGDPGRWFHLPPFCLLPDDMRVEDIGRSRKVVAEGASGRVIR